MSARAKAMEITVLERRIASLQAEIARIDSLPEEPPNDGDVLYFEKNFGNRRNVSYRYAAIRAKGEWFVTGHSRVYTWHELLDFIASREVTMPKVWVVNEWEQLI